MDDETPIGGSRYGGSSAPAPSSDEAGATSQEQEQVDPAQEVDPIFQEHCDRLLMTASPEELKYVAEKVESMMNPQGEEGESDSPDSFSDEAMPS